MNLNEAKQLLNGHGYKLIKEDAENSINLEVVVYDDGYRPSIDEIADSPAAKEWIKLLNSFKSAGGPFKMKFKIDETNLKEVLEKIRIRYKNNYSFSYLTGYVNGTINGNVIDYENIDANDIEYDLKKLFRKYGIEI